MVDNEILAEKKQLADMVKRLRAYANMSQRELASKTGITQADISRIESGKGNPSINTIARIMEATGTSLCIDYIIKEPEIIIEQRGVVEPRIMEIATEATEKAVKTLGEELEKAILFGSCARGDNNEESDIDVALIMNCDRTDISKYSKRVVDVACEIGCKYFEMVNFICLPLKEYIEKQSWYPFYKNIKNEGILLYER